MQFLGFFVKEILMNLARISAIESAKTQDFRMHLKLHHISAFKKKNRI